MAQVPCHQRRYRLARLKMPLDLAVFGVGVRFPTQVAQIALVQMALVALVSVVQVVRVGEVRVVRVGEVRVVRVGEVRVVVG